MPRLTANRLPKYRKHKASGQAVVTLNGRDFYLGPYGTKASRREYDRLMGEWIANGRRLAAANGADLTINELILAFWRHAERYYRKPDGSPTSELDCIRLAMRPLKVLYGETPAGDFSPLPLKTVRQRMIQADLCRNVINQHVARIKRMFKWAVENELVPPGVYHGLQAVTGLRQGRSEARESEPVTPVPDAHVDPVLPHLSLPVATMVALQRLTAMRPGEVAIVRACDLDTTGKVWFYRPAAHKTEHHGHGRVIPLGPKAQAAVKSFLKPQLEEYLFKPEEAEAHQRAEKRENRKTPLWPGHLRMQAKRKRTRRRRRFKACYDANSYRRAIHRACDRAGVPRWSPNQLRHLAATRIRRRYGLEAAQVVLGHQQADVTQIYAERNIDLAAEVMAKIG